VQTVVASPASAVPTVPSVLAVISAGRLLDLCRLLGCEVRKIAGGKDRLVSKLAEHLGARLPAPRARAGRAVCRRHSLDPSARASTDLQALLLDAAGLDPRVAAGDRVVIASLPTLKRGESARITDPDPADFHLVVVDEAHHAVAPTYRRVFDHCGLFAPESRRLLVGFTATPRRGDNKGVGDVFREIAFRKTLPEMFADGFRCPVRGWQVASGVDLDGVRTRHGDFVESDLVRAPSPSPNATASW